MHDDSVLRDVLFKRLKANLPIVESRLVVRPFPEGGVKEEENNTNIITQQPFVPLLNEKIIDENIANDKVINKIKEKLEEKNKK